MAGASRGDLVLGGRHLAGISALLVVVLGVVFTLGYLLGRSRYEDQARAIAANSGPAAAPDASASRGSAPSAGPKTSEVPAAVPPPTSWEFYRSGEPAGTPDLEPVPRTSLTQPKPQPPPPEPPRPAAAAVAPVKTPRPLAAPPPRPRATGGSALIPKGAITLQVAAFLREAEALTLAQTLQEKKFPAIVLTPSTDKYYRVQVGPYPNGKSAAAARRALEKQGFETIVRR